MNQPIIKRSSKLDGQGKFIHEGIKKRLARNIIGICWPGEQPGMVVVLGETQTFYGQPDRFVLAECQCSDAGQLLDVAARLVAEFKGECYGKTTASQQEYLTLWNRTRFDQNRQRLKIFQAPGLEGSDLVTQHIQVVIDNLRSDNKHLHLFSDSSLPALLSALPLELHNIKASQFPAAASLGYAMSSAVTYSEDDVNESDLIPEILPDY